MVNLLLMYAWDLIAKHLKKIMNYFLFALAFYSQLASCKQSFLKLKYLIGRGNYFKCINKWAFAPVYTILMISHK